MSEDGHYVSEVEPYGLGDFTMFGVESTLRWDGRDEPNAPRSGGLFEVVGRVRPALGDVEETYGGVQGTATFSVAMGPPVLSVKVSGEKVCPDPLLNGRGSRPRRRINGTPGASSRKWCGAAPHPGNGTATSLVAGRAQQSTLDSPSTNTAPTGTRNFARLRSRGSICSSTPHRRTSTVPHKKGARTRIRRGRG